MKIIKLGGKIINCEKIDSVSVNKSILTIVVNGDCLVFPLGETNANKVFNILYTKMGSDDDSYSLDVDKLLIKDKYINNI